MCLLVFSVQPDAQQTLLLAGNRDEFHRRPSEPLGWWRDKPNILGGRDLRAGGTWLAASADGRFATVTNSRDAAAPDPGLRSRGLLVTDFLESSQPPIDFLEALEREQYAGFNLVISDGNTVAYGSNRDGKPRLLDQGIYALSNAVLDTPWHKVEYARRSMRELLEKDLTTDEDLYRLLGNEERAPLEDVDQDRLPRELAHAVTAPFIIQPEYGTRCSTIVRIRRDGDISISERRFGADGSEIGDTRRSYVGASTP